VLFETVLKNALDSKDRDAVEVQVDLITYSGRYGRRVISNIIS
jgi:hypothetical protein